MNVPRISGAVISMRMATMYELETVYGLEDAYNLVEIAVVDAHNRKLLNPPRT